MNDSTLTIPPCNRDAVSPEDVYNIDDSEWTIVTHRGRKKMFYLMMHSTHFI